MKRLLLTIIVFLMSYSLSFSTSYYVSSIDGDNADDGLTEEDAWLTIAHVSGLSAGDTVYGEGTHREQLIPSDSGSDGLPITYTSYGDGWTILGSVDGELLTWTDMTGNIYRTDSSTFAYDVGMIYYNTTSGTFGNGTKETAHANLNANWEFWYDAVNDRVEIYHDVGTPEDQCVGLEITKRVSAVSGTEAIITFTGKSYLTFSNIELKYGNGYAVKVHGAAATATNLNFDNITASYCGAEDTDADGVGDYGGGISVMGHTLTDVVVENCTVFECWDGGISSEAINNDDTRSNITFRDNTVYKCPAGVNVTGTNTKTGQTFSNTEISGNTVYDGGTGIFGLGTFTNGVGIQVTWESTGTCSGISITDNLSYDNTGYGYNSKGISGLTLSGNKFYGNSKTGVRFSGAGTNECAGTVASNLIYDNGEYGLALIGNSGVFNLYNNDFYENSTGGNYYEIYLVTGITNATIKNNIVVNSTRPAVWYADTSAPTSDYNDLHSGHATAKMHWQGNNYATLALYQAASSQDANSIASDPMFRDAANGDFTLTKESDCIDAGTDVGISQDYDGRGVPRKGIPDMGAYEARQLGRQNIKRLIGY